MSCQFTHVAVAVMVTVIAAHPLAGQTSGGPTQRLARPDATFPEPFSSVGGMRELSDGRLVLSDRLERSVRLVDLDASTFEEIGHTGSGPGEYQMPGLLLPLPGDSTLLVDLGNIRMTVIDPSGRFGSSTSLLQDRFGFMNPRATDAQGRLYFEMPPSFQGAATPPDSTPIVRWDRTRETLDTVGMLPTSAMGVVRVSAAGGGGSFSGAGMRPFAPRDAWDADRSGRVGIVRASAYRVEWCTGSRCRSGPAVAFDPVPVTDADKEEWAERMGQGQAVMITSGGQGSGGSRSMRMPTPDVDAVEWPETKPAFQPTGIYAAPEGELWVQRYGRAGASTTFDIFDGEGRRVRQVVLPADRRFLGFGDGVVYLIRVDDDGLQWLERYRR